MFHRKNNRLGNKELYQKNNWYFVTICIQDRKCIFEMLHCDNFNNGDTEVASTTGVVISSLIQVTYFYNDIELLDWVVMPNHLHFVVKFKQKPSGPHSEKLISLGDFVKSFKVAFQKKIVEATSVSPFIKEQMPCDFNYHKFWQRSYYDHIIRDESELLRIREYIRDNPKQWELDILNPINERKYKQKFD
jgi:putative transposase